MRVTVSPDENRSIRVTDETVRVRPPDRIAFEIRGTIAVTEDLLGGFAGASLKPVRIDVATDDSPVAIDLEGPASLRLDAVDVGVEVPDADDLSAGVDALRPSEDDADSTGTRPGAVAFTVEGTISSVPSGTLESIANADPALESIAFAVEDPVRGDGGSGDDVLAALTFFGYGVVVRRSGVVEIGTGPNAPDVGPV